MDFRSVVLKHQWLEESVLNNLPAQSDAQLFARLKSHYHIPEGRLLSVVAGELGLRFAKMAEFYIDSDWLLKFDHSVLNAHRIFPLYETEDRLYVATDSPFQPLDHLLNAAKKIMPVLVESHELNRCFQDQVDTAPLDTLDTILFRAIEKHASDVHFFQKKMGIEIQFRIDGTLHLDQTLSSESATQLLQILKLRAHMDISKTTVPQDGRLQLSKGNQDWDIRVASLPTLWGEDMVCRFLYPTSQLADFHQCGFSQPMRDHLTQLLSLKSGLILVTGATGSGKTTTLYACLNALAGRGQNIVTLEDPIEAVIPHARQSQINSVAGFDFPHGLRAILRQDPDIIMVGEIRDHETAKMAVDAAYTGHLVLSSLHTADIDTTLLRLSSFGLDPFLVRHCIKGIVSQKLVPKRCQDCRGELCPKCHGTGNFGRTVLAEILVVQQPDSPDNPRISYSQDLEMKVAQGLI